MHRPKLMGILNVNGDSFSDPRPGVEPEERVAAGIALRDGGADLVDVGAESASPATPVVAVDAEIAALLPVLEGLHAAGTVTSVDTYKPDVAAAAIAAGTAIVNDYSGLAHPEIIEVCASSTADLVLTHNPAQIKHKLLDDDLYDDVAAHALRWFETTLSDVELRGLPRERVILDPGIDLSKTPAQSIAILRALPALADAFGLRLLVAISRKDFIGAVTATAPRDRGPGTLAALAAVSAVPNTIARIHDVTAAAQFLDILEAVATDGPVSSSLRLDPALGREHP